MTWVIGMAGLLSRGILIADTRITLHDPTGRAPDREFDGVQKVHPIHGNMAMAFAGNIDTGFTLVSDLNVMARNSIPAEHLTNEPSRLLFTWARRARYHWDNTLSERERSGGCSLLFVGALPPHSEIGITPNVAYRAPGARLHTRACAVAYGGRDRKRRTHCRIRRRGRSHVTGEGQPSGLRQRGVEPNGWAAYRPLGRAC